MNESGERKQEIAGGADGQEQGDTLQWTRVFRQNLNIRLQDSL